MSHVYRTIRTAADCMGLVKLCEDILGSAHRTYKAGTFGAPQTCRHHPSLALRLIRHLNGVGGKIKHFERGGEGAVNTRTVLL